MTLVSYIKGRKNSYGEMVYDLYAYGTHLPSNIGSAERQRKGGKFYFTPTMRAREQGLHPTQHSTMAGLCLYLGYEIDTLKNLEDRRKVRAEEEMKRRLENEKKAAIERGEVVFDTIEDLMGPPEVERRSAI